MIYDDPDGDYYPDMFDWQDRVVVPVIAPCPMCTRRREEEVHSHWLYRRRWRPIIDVELPE